MLCRKVSKFVAKRAGGQFFTPYLVGKIRHVDAHRAGHGAKAVTGAGCITKVFICLLKGLQAGRIRAVGLKAGNLSLGHDSRPGAKGKAAGQAVNLAETTLDAFIQFVVNLLKFRLFRPDCRFKNRQSLEVLYEALGIVVKNNARIQYALRVKESLHTLHYFIGLTPPLILYEGSHVAAGTVLGLKRAIVLPYHHFCHVADHSLVTGNFFIRVKCLIYNKMEVSFQRMTVDAGVVVTMLIKQCRKVCGSLRQILNMEGDILYKAGSPLFAKSTHSGENTGPDGPVRCIFLRVRCKLNLAAEGLQNGLYGRYFAFQSLFVRCPHLCKYSRQVRD